MMPMASMRVIFKGLVLVLLLALVALYVGDWLVFRYQVAHGTAYDSVQVNQFLSVRLKGQKEEFDYLGPQQVQCVRTIFPRAGADPCWWVRRHAEKWTNA